MPTVEGFFEIDVNHDTVALGNVRLCLGHRLMGRAPRTEPVAVFGRPRAPLRLKNLQHGLLDQSVDDTGDPVSSRSRLTRRQSGKSI